MKTTIDLSDALFEAARAHAAAGGRTLRSVVEEALRRLLDAEAPAEPFVLRDASFGGQGLQPDAAALSAAERLERAYEGRGGA